ncbi:MAG: HAMP domain-containing histidine kinase [Actinomycetota bacterium]|nr:HAMP domain-containing histidine kinase [Actinomycetota bacterium]
MTTFGTDPQEPQLPNRDPYEDLRVSFTAAVSHELRTPLARLLALLENASLPGADVQAAIAQARSEVEHMDELVDDVLFLSELETGREVVSLGSTLAAPLLREVAEELQERAERAGVTLGVEVEDESIELPLRARMLRIVVQNLAENALRHAGEAATCVLSLGREDGRRVLSVSDDGAGVEPHELARLFERFYRADRARTSRGTGLGLAIVKHVVEAAGGEVTADGGPGRGLRIRCAFTSR